MQAPCTAASAAGTSASRGRVHLQRCAAAVSGVMGRPGGPTPRQQQQLHHQHHHQPNHHHHQLLPPLRAGFGGFSSSGGAKKRSSNDCPCGSGLLYKQCCQPLHKSAVLTPDSPEALIRARFSAFCKKQAKFLQQTSHPDNPALAGSSTQLPDGTVRQCSYLEDLAVTFVSVHFTGLTITDATTAPDGASASVDIEARFLRLIDETGKRVAKPAEQVWRERSQLVRGDEGRWLVREVTALGGAVEE